MHVKLSFNSVQFNLLTPPPNWLHPTFLIFLSIHLSCFKLSLQPSSCLGHGMVFKIALQFGISPRISASSPDSKIFIFSTLLYFTSWIWILLWEKMHTIWQIKWPILIPGYRKIFTKLSSAFTFVIFTSVVPYVPLWVPI